MPLELGDYIKLVAIKIIANRIKTYMHTDIMVFKIFTSHYI